MVTLTQGGWHLPNPLEKERGHGGVVSAPSPRVCPWCCYPPTRTVVIPGGKGGEGGEGLEIFGEPITIKATVNC